MLFSSRKVYWFDLAKAQLYPIEGKKGDADGCILEIDEESWKCLKPHLARGCDDKEMLSAVKKDRRVQIEMRVKGLESLEWFTIHREALGKMKNVWKEILGFGFKECRIKFFGVRHKRLVVSVFLGKARVNLAMLAVACGAGWPAHDASLERSMRPRLDVWNMEVMAIILQMAIHRKVGGWSCMSALPIPSRALRYLQRCFLKQRDRISQQRGDGIETSCNQDELMVVLTGTDLIEEGDCSWQNILERSTHHLYDGSSSLDPLQPMLCFCKPSEKVRIGHRCEFAQRLFRAEISKLSKKKDGKDLWVASHRAAKVIEPLVVSVPHSSLLQNCKHPEQVYSPLLAYPGVPCALLKWAAAFDTLWNSSKHFFPKPAAGIRPTTIIGVEAPPINFLVSDWEMHALFSGPERSTHNKTMALERLREIYLVGSKSHSNILSQNLLRLVPKLFSPLQDGSDHKRPLDFNVLGNKIVWLDDLEAWLADAFRSVVSAPRRRRTKVQSKVFDDEVLLHALRDSVDDWRAAHSFGRRFDKGLVHVAGFSSEGEDDEFEGNFSEQALEHICGREISRRRKKKESLLQQAEIEGHNDSVQQFEKTRKETHQGIRRALSSAPEKLQHWGPKQLFNLLFAQPSSSSKAHMHAPVVHFIEAFKIRVVSSGKLGSSVETEFLRLHTLGWAKRFPAWACLSLSPEGCLEQFFATVSSDRSHKCHQMLKKMVATLEAAEKTLYRDCFSGDLSLESQLCNWSAKISPVYSLLMVTFLRHRLGADASEPLRPFEFNWMFFENTRQAPCLPNWRPQATSGVDLNLAIDHSYQWPGWRALLCYESSQ